MKLTIMNDEYAVLYVPVSPATAVLAGRLEGRRRWLREGGLKFEPSGMNVDIVREIYGEDLELTDHRPEETEPEARAKYEMKTAPYPHQADALAAMDGRPNFALFAEQGTGKTKVAIDRMCDLWCRGEIEVVLVVAPKGVHRQWAESQIPEHSGLEDIVAYWWKGAPRKDPWGIVGSPIAGGLRWICVNYDALRGAGLAAVEDAISRRKFALILDESHNVKNVKTKRWRACRELSRRPECKVRLAMTGTPIAKNLEDEWAQLRIVDESILGIRYVTHFRNEYCIMGGFEGRQVVGARNVEKFKRLTAPHVFRATKAALGIEAKQYDRWKFDMTSMQKAMYDRMRKELIAEIDAGVYTSAGGNAAVAVIRLQQISNGWVQPEPEEDGGPAPPIRDLFDRPEQNPRVQALLEYLGGSEEPLATIIWVRFRQDVAVLASVLGEQAVQYHGGVGDRERESNIRTWLRDDGPPYLIATPGSGGTGLNLQGRCRRAVYWSNNENSIQRWQSEDRIHRIGVTGVCTYTDIVATGSRDMAILANLRRKKSLSDLTLDDIRTELLEVDRPEDNRTLQQIAISDALGIFGG